MDTSLSTGQDSVNMQCPRHSNAENSQTEYNPSIVAAFLTMLDHRSLGGVTEIRIFPEEHNLSIKGRRTYVGKTVVGYYEPDQYVQATQDIAVFDGRGQIYVCLNACKPELLARSANRLQFGARYTATDADIIALQWFRVDCDPIRPSGISASDTELEQALLCRDAIAADVEGYGAQAVKAMSGNGGHLLIRLPDYPNDEEHRALVESATKRIADEFSDDVV